VLALILVGGVCGALTLNTTAWEEHRVATVADGALRGAQDARADAISSRQLLHPDDTPAG
jgi:hypothetical protein